jgi:hypothetical protein
VRLRGLGEEGGERKSHNAKEKKRAKKDRERSEERREGNNLRKRKWVDGAPLSLRPRRRRARSKRQTHMKKRMDPLAEWARGIVV